MSGQKTPHRQNVSLEAFKDAAIEKLSASYAQAVAHALLHGPSVENAHWRVFSLGVARTLLLADLIGMAQATRAAKIRGATFVFEDDKIEPDKFAAIPDLLTSIGEDSEFFFVAEFTEAIQSFESKVPRLASQVRGMAKKSRDLSQTITSLESTVGFETLVASSVAMQNVIANSFWVTGVTKKTTINVKQILADVITGEATPEEMTISGFIDRAQAEGAANLTRHRLETVMRNNVQTAYNSGQVEIMSSPEVKNIQPLIMILEIRDRRSRGNPAGLYPNGGKHFQMHAYINTLEALESMGIVPPNGHNCRGSIRGVTWTEAEDLGLLDGSGNVDPAKLAKYNGQRQNIIDAGEYPDEGWIS